MMNTAEAQRLFTAYAQIQAKLKIMEQEAKLKNKARQEARRKLTEALGRLEVVVGGLTRLTKQGKTISLAALAPTSIDGVRVDRFKRCDT